MAWHSRAFARLVNLRKMLPEEAAPVEESEELAFCAPSSERAYDFEVRVRLTRRPTGPSWGIDEEIGRIRDLVRETVRATTCGLSIFQADDAERRVNEALPERLAQELHSRRATVRWQARAELALPAEIRELRRDHLRTAEETRLRMSRLRESRLVCEQFLTEAARSWYARYAVRLIETPDKAGEIVERMMDTRRKDADEPLKVFEKIASACRDASALEFMIASDHALRAAFERLGLPLPPPDPDSLFASVDQAG